MSRADAWARRLALLAVLAVAAGLRFTALGYGAGIDARPDEPGVLMTLDMLGPTGSRSPMLGLYGATFFLPLFAVVRLEGLWQGWSAPLSTVQLVPALVVARAWSATLSMLAVWLTYRLGRRVGDWGVGVLAGAILAVSPLVVREAHSAKPDSAAMAVTAAWLLLVVRPWPSSKWRAFALGAAAAFVADTKLLLGIGLPMLVAVLWPGADGRRPRWRDAILSLVAFGAVTTCLRWYVIADPHTWHTYLPLVLDSTRVDRFPGADQVPGPLRYHATISFRYGCGLVAATLMPIAFVRGLGGKPELRILAVAVAGIMLPVLLSQVVLARFVLPILPPLCVLVAALMCDVMRRLPGRHLAAAVAAMALLTAEPLYQSLTLVRLLGRTDTRLQAAAWIDSNVAPGSRVATWGAVGVSDFGSPPMRGMIVRREVPRRDPDGTAWFVLHTYPIPWANARAAIPDAFERVAIFSPYDGPTDGPVFEPLDAVFLPLARFRGVARPGPYIEVYRRRPPNG